MFIKIQLHAKKTKTNKQTNKNSLQTINGIHVDFHNIYGFVCLVFGLLIFACYHYNGNVAITVMSESFIVFCFYCFWFDADIHISVFFSFQTVAMFCQNKIYFVNSSRLHDSNQSIVRQGIFKFFFQLSTVNISIKVSSLLNSIYSWFQSMSMYVVNQYKQYQVACARFVLIISADMLVSIFAYLLLFT